MERLTEPGGSRCEGCQDTGECAYIAGEFPVPCPDAVRYERLKVYEDTGLEPENLQSSVVRHGRWVNEDFPNKLATPRDMAICSICGEWSEKAEHGYAILSKYCPNCGARMQAEQAQPQSTLD